MQLAVQQAADEHDESGFAEHGCMLCTALPHVACFQHGGNGLSSEHACIGVNGKRGCSIQERHVEVEVGDRKKNSKSKSKNKEKFDSDSKSSMRSALQQVTPLLHFAVATEWQCSEGRHRMHRNAIARQTSVVFLKNPWHAG